jgi:hypothetical protein
MLIILWIILYEDILTLLKCIKYPVDVIVLLYCTSFDFFILFWNVFDKAFQDYERLASLKASLALALAGEVPKSGLMSSSLNFCKKKKIKIEERNLIYHILIPKVIIFNVALSEFRTETHSFRMVQKIIHKQLKHKLVHTFSGYPSPKTILVAPVVINLITFIKGSSFWVHHHIIYWKETSVP